MFVSDHKGRGQIVGVQEQVVVENIIGRYFYGKIEAKVKVTPVQALRLCTGRTAHRGSRGIALPFHNHSTRRG